MPSRPPVRRDADLSRRTAITGAAALGVAGAVGAVAGCTPRGTDPRPQPSPSSTRSPRTDPDVALAATVLADEQDMLDRVLATLDRHPALEAVLAGPRSAHQAHVDLLTEAVPDEPASSGSPSASATPGPGRAVPNRVRAALVALAREEDRLGGLGRRSAFAAESGAFARVLASMAASAAQQSVALSAAATARR